MQKICIYNYKRKSGAVKDIFGKNTARNTPYKKFLEGADWLTRGLHPGILLHGIYGGVLAATKVSGY